MELFCNICGKKMNVSIIEGHYTSQFLHSWLCENCYSIEKEKEKKKLWIPELIVKT